MTYTVFKYSDLRRPYYVVRWKNGPPGMEKGERSTKQKTHRKAESWAAKFVESLNADGSAADSVTWSAFMIACEDRYFPTLASPASYRSALRAVERYLRPRHLDDITADSFVALREKMLRHGAKETSCTSYAKMFRAALGFAERERMLAKAPAVKTGQTDKMRGRALTLEEFERYLVTLEKHVGTQRYPAWRRVCLGAWAIGFRRSEFTRVWWDRPDRIHFRGLDSTIPRVFFPASQHKARRDAELPLSPEAIDSLREVPKSQRTGLVYFPLRGRRKQIKTADGLGRLLRDVGELAGIVTEIDDETGEKRFATVHDFRKSLGTRLLHHERLSIPEVTQVMRHCSIKTTMDHYNTLNVGKLGEKLRSLEGCIPSCTADSDGQRVSTS